MLKKFILTSVIAAATAGANVAMANAAPYVGASLGIVTNTSDVKVIGSNFTGGAYRGMPFNVYAGYGGLIGQNFYLAGELNGTISTANLSDDTNLRSSYSYGASVIPGLMLGNNVLAYARAGVISTRFPNSSDTAQRGGQFGLGMQVGLTQCVDLRGEYDVISYQAKSFSSNGTITSIAPNSDQFSLGLVYKFD